MKLIICDDYNGVSKAAADIVAKEVNSNPECVLGLATGSTPVGMYEILADMNKAGEVDFKKVKSFNLDEYYPLSAENDQSYHYFMNENFFSKINIDKSNTHILNGMCENAEKECEQFEKLIEETGGIDLQILDIGQNGHIGFNEPSDNLCSLTHLTDLTENTIDANSRFFNSIDDVPKQVLTMGIGTILKARKIIIMACGANKHDAVRALLSGLISTDMPASMLNVHTDVTLICDKEAYSNDCIGIDLGGTEIKFGVLSSDKKLVYKVDAAKSAAEANTDSVLNKIYSEKGKMNGRVFFDAVEKACPVAKAVLDEYINYFAIGIKNIYNILDPELIVLSSGITNSDKLLSDPLKRALGDDIKVAISKLKSDAGTIGAALLV